MCPSGTATPPLADLPSDFRPAFDVLDADHDGKISRDDLRSFYSTASFPADDDVIGSMISVADSNKDGFVEYDEFERVLGCRESSKRGGAGIMEDVFRVMDRDGDGKVGRDDLKGYMEWAGFYATDEDIMAMIRLGGGDEKEGVSFDGLLKILALDFVD